MTSLTLLAVYFTTFTITNWVQESIASLCQKESIIEGFRSRKYFREVRPQYHQDTPTEVRVSFYVQSVYAVSEVNMEYTIDIYLRQRWHDPRLAFDLCDEYINLTSDWLDIIWVPDMFFLNSKSAMFHDITLRNVGLHISPNGSVFFTQRLGITLGCVMELLKFPLDVQKCDTQIMSYTHKADELTILWFEEHEPVQIDPHVRLPQTKIRTTQHGDCWRMYEGKNYSCIYVEFELQRLNGFYVIQIYVPGVLIVMLSWVSFWLDPRATPARVSLGLLCVLTTTTHTTGVNSSLPRVSYIKAMDVWNFTCLLFVFGALLEFALINVKTRKEEATAKEMLQRKSRTTSKKQANKTNRWEMSFVPFAPAAKSEEEKVNGVEVKQDDVKGAMYWTAERLDKTCRIIFPVAFLVFNVFYWLYYKLS